MTHTRRDLLPLQIFQKSLGELSRFLGTPEPSKSDSIFTGVVLDSRVVEPGDLFIALPGAKNHGAIFAQQVIAAGAIGIVTDEQGAANIFSEFPVIIVPDPRAVAGVIASWFYSNPFDSLGAVGVTGTNGKTTTTALIEELWRLDGRSTGSIGTIGLTIDGEQFEGSFTTPEGTDLQAIAATMRERHVRNMVMEVSSHALALHRVAGARYAISGFTNLTQDHLDFHGTMENYFQAKAKLFTPQFSDMGIVNIDDPYGLRLYEDAHVEMQSYSRSNKRADWYYQSFELLPTGLGYRIAIRGVGGILIEGNLPLLGLHNLDNALLAIAIVCRSGVDPIAVQANLEKLTAPIGRLEPIYVGQSFLALVDFAHTPDAVSRALSTARTLTDGKVIAVLGCGGDRDRTKRPIMGQALREGADIAIFTSDNPRSEDPFQILDEMLGAGRSSTDLVEPDRKQAIALAVSSAQARDCVIVLGKGHERGQEINGKKFPFDDRIELARAIEGLK